MDEFGMLSESMEVTEEEFELQKNSAIPLTSNSPTQGVIVHEKQLRRRLEYGEHDKLDNPFMNDESQDVIHSKLSKEMVPKVGMEFTTEEEAYEFYNAYALEVGFCIRRSKSHCDNKGKILDRVFVCSCEGKRGPDKRDDVYKSHRSETRFGCLAQLKISCRQTCKYYVVKFI